MNDTTNTPDQAPVAKVTPYQLMDTLGKVLFAHIEALVEAKVNDIFQNHATMRLLDEKTEQLMRNIADEAVDEHERDYEHIDRDEISDTVATHIAHTDFDRHIKQAVHEMLHDGDYPTEERVQEMMDDIDFDEKVKEVLRNI